MAFNVSRTAFDAKKEILKFPAGLDAIQSVVVQASAATALASAITGKTGQLGLEVGTILTKIPGDSKVRYRKYTGAGGEAITGILGNRILFYDASDKSDQPADMLFHGCVFDKAKIVDYNTHAAALATALPTCRFE